MSTTLSPFSNAPSITFPVPCSFFSSLGKIIGTPSLSETAVAIGIPAATRVARALGKKDPQQVVIDGVAGQLITLVGAPLHWKAMLAGLILFRVFDMWKPFPVRNLEKLPEGTGIVLDDVAAGVYGLIVMQLLLRFGILG